MADIDISAAAVEAAAWLRDWKSAMLYHSDRADALSAERDRLTGANHELRTLADALQSRVAELEGAIDTIETSHGLTDNGNLWRFWSRKAGETAKQNVELTARAEAAEAEVARLKAELPRAWEKGRDAAATAADYTGAIQDQRDGSYAGSVAVMGRDVGDAIRALTPPADLAEMVRGDSHE